MIENRGDHISEIGVTNTILMRKNIQKGIGCEVRAWATDGGAACRSSRKKRAAPSQTMTEDNSPSAFVIPENLPPDRADKVLADCLADRFTRSAVSKLIRQGKILVGGHRIRPSTVISPGDRVEFVAVQTTPRLEPAREAPEFRIIFEDSDVIVVDKPAGLVVHPGAGRPSETLMDILVRTRPEMIGVGEPGRWGVVHRLDKDTSGVMVVAKTIEAYQSLSRQFREHSVRRMYLAIVRGNPSADSGTVTAGLGRHVKDRKRMSVSTTKARHAVTGWRVIRRLGSAVLLQVFPETGRTHQIRVHLASVGLPVLGDPVYGKTRRRTTFQDAFLKKATAVINRQALHAALLGFVHPRSGEMKEFVSPVPDDMAAVLGVSV